MQKLLTFAQTLVRLCLMQNGWYLHWYTTGTKENSLLLTLNIIPYMNGYYCYSNEREQFNSLFSLFFCWALLIQLLTPRYDWRVWLCGGYEACRSSKFIQNEQYHEYFMARVSQKTFICCLSLRCLPKKPIQKKKAITIKKRRKVIECGLES